MVDEARITKKELLLFKFDLEKTCDFVDFKYLDAIMGKMNFPFLWRKWVMKCVYNVTASVLVNRYPTNEFHLDRGFRQGDNLFSFSFFIGAKGLNVMMKATAEAGLFKGYVVGCTTHVHLSRLQFVHDTS